MKKKRHDKILEIISSKPIYNQKELLDELTAAGFDAAQPTISRDIKELGLIKLQNSSGNYIYAQGVSDVSDGSRVNSIFADSVVSIDYSLNIVVVKCHAGMANAACAVLDGIEHKNILGTIAGDDTIFIVTTGAEESAELKSDLTLLMR